MDKKRLRHYMIPNIFAMLGISCYILADTYFISGAAGAAGITALNLALPVYGLIFAIGSMIGIGSSIRYALGKATGEESADQYFSNAVWWVIFIALPIVALGVSAPAQVLRLMGADQTILQTGTVYMKIALCCAPFFMLNYVATSFVRNDGSPRIAMAATLISSFFNIVFDYILMFPCKMGMAGAALATGLSPVVSILVCMTHYLSKKNTIRFTRNLPSFKKLREACVLGVSAFVGEIAGGITTMVFNLILLRLSGNIAVAAYGVIANLALVGTAIFNGIAQGLQPMASEAHGKNDRKGEIQILFYSIRTALVLAAGMLFAVCLFAAPFTEAFNSEGSAELTRLAEPGLRIYFTGFLLAGVNIVRAGFYSAVDCPAVSSLIAVLRGIGMIVLFAFLLSGLWGITGVWMAFPASELTTFLVTLPAVKKIRNKRGIT